MLIKYFKVLFLLFFLFISGCNADDEAGSNINQILDAMSEQTEYGFSGSTSVTMSEIEYQDVVQFNGLINKKDNLYLDLTIASIEGMPEEKMEFATIGDKMFVKYSYDEKWSEVAEDEFGIYLELNNWNPEKMLQVIKDSKVSAEPVDDQNGGREGILVKVDSATIKKDIENQLNMQLQDSTLTEEEKNELKESMGLTDEEIVEYEQELQQQLAESKVQIEEIIRTMEVESVYELYYDSNNLLLNEIRQKTITSYQLMGENVEEVTVVDMKFNDYGKENEMPEI